MLWHLEIGILEQAFLRTKKTQIVSVQLASETSAEPLRTLLEALETLLRVRCHRDPGKMVTMYASMRPVTIGQLPSERS